MINGTIQKALNDHIQEETYSSYLYLSMAAYATKENLNGFAHWFKIQSKEEWSHALKIYDHLLTRGGQVHLKEIKKPPQNFGSMQKMLEATLAHERSITKKIDKLYEQAARENDHATATMLHWFINEQVEEEAAVVTVLEKLKRVENKSAALLYLDKEMGKREG